MVTPDAPGPFVTPAYGTRSLADLLDSAYAVLGAGGTDRLGLAAALPGVRRIVVLLVDGLGAHLLPLATPVAPALAAATVLTPLTCGFPSTTPTSLVSLGAGTPPGAHGVVGFTVRRPDTGRPFTHIHWDDDVDPRQWQPVPSRFDTARSDGLSGQVVAPAAFSGTGLTVAAYGDARYRGADAAGTVAAVSAALAATPRGVVYAYRPEVDRAGHRAGPGSPVWLAAVAAVDRVVAGIAAALPADAALLVVADHGMVRATEDDRIDLDSRPELLAGTRLITGEGRARYVHVEPGASTDVLAAWRAVLGDRALVVSRDEAIASGWYGPTTHTAAARIGDVVAVCRDRWVLVRRAAEPVESSFAGNHGSLTEAELRVPLLLLRPGQTVVPRG